VLEVSGLDVRYGKSHVVFGLGLLVGEGEVLALLGRNGAGKTTSIHGILGLASGATGRVVVGGVDMSRWPAYRRAQGGIAYVPSGARCFPNLTVGENLDIAARRKPRSGPSGRLPPRGGENGGDGWGRERVYELFPKLRELAASMAGALSGGERQMLAVGRALMSNPRVLLLDEPTEGLAPVIVQSLTGLVRQLKETGVAILLAEQNHQMALRVADRAAFMEKGKVVEELPADQARGSEVLHRILGV
jgi:branched-chain amino acid transport system ATP-binding protein